MLWMDQCPRRRCRYRSLAVTWAVLLLSVTAVLLRVLSRSAASLSPWVMAVLTPGHLLTGSECAVLLVGLLS